MKKLGRHSLLTTLTFGVFVALLLPGCGGDESTRTEPVVSSGAVPSPVRAPLPAPPPPAADAKAAPIGVIHSAGKIQSINHPPVVEA